MRTQTVLHDEEVATLRRVVKERGHYDVSDLLEKYKISDATLKRALLGFKPFDRVNRQEPALTTLKGSFKLREAARALYRDGLSYNQIVERLHVPKSSLSKWCSGMIKPKVKPPKASPLKKGIDGEIPFQDYIIYFYTHKTKGPFVEIIHKETKKRTSLTLGRYLISLQEKRLLEKHEMVIRVKEGCDDVSAFQLIDRRESIEKTRLSKTKSCLSCGKEYYSKHRDSSTCSIACRDVYHAIRMTGVNRPMFKCLCVVCETEFYSSKRHDDVCKTKSCQDIIRVENEREFSHD